ncbi:MAG: hypothetical protein ACRDRW_08795 [Pseudonocardiaceae bacterium]
MGTFMLRLRLGGAEPPTGTISAPGGTVAQSFYGWIDLMSAINRLRRGEGLEPDERAPTELPSHNPRIDNRHDVEDDFDL